MYYERYDDLCCDEEAGWDRDIPAGAGNIDLYDVIDRSDDARDYFMALPRDVRELLESRGEDIRTVEELRVRAGDILDCGRMNG